MSHSRWNLTVTVDWPTSVFAVYVWLILAAAFVVIPLLVAYALGKREGHACAGRGRREHL